jgi:hypothetical protein
MRFSFVVAMALMGISVSGSAQQSNTLKVKRSAPEKAPKKSAPISEMGAHSATASAAASKDLRNIEHQTAKSSTSAPKRTSGTASTLKPVKDKPSPPINFSGNTAHKSAGPTNQGANPYQGRLKQKHTHQ